MAWVKYGLYLLKRNLHSLAVLPLIRGGSDCLFLRQTTVYDAMLLAEVLKPIKTISMQCFSWKSSTSHFY
jgi:hypothetical protein